MNVLFTWAQRPSPEKRIFMPANRNIYIVSDIHLGDGSRSDAFVGKDSVFLDFLDQVETDKAHLIINGDIIDFPQAITFTRVLRAHGPLLRRLSELKHGITYVWGNHDYDIALYRDLLRWDVCSSVQIGDEVLIKHGHQHDPFIANSLRESAFSTLIHHQVERFLGTWIRTPLEDFYTISGRLVFWLAWLSTKILRPFYKIMAKFGTKDKNQAFEEYLDYWLHSQVGNPMKLFTNIQKPILESSTHYFVTGHSHVPGLVQVGDKKYVNTGSWTFKCSTFAFWNGTEFKVQDFVSKHSFTDENYLHLIKGTLSKVNFDIWWKQEYKGWLRFKCGEQKKRKLPVDRWYHNL